MISGVGTASTGSGEWLLSLHDLPAVVRVHERSFASSKLTRLGHDAVCAYYNWLLTGPHDCTAIGVGEKGELWGFLVGGYFRGAASGFVKRAWPLLVISALRRPMILWDREVVSRSYGMVRILLRRAPPAVAAIPSPWGVLSMAVDPSARGRGYGAALLRIAEAHAVAAGAQLMQLSVRPTNVAAVALYEKAGWHREPATTAWSGRMIKALR